MYFIQRNMYKKRTIDKNINFMEYNIYFFLFYLYERFAFETK